MLDIFLAGPDDFYGTVDVLRDLDGANDAIDFQPPAKAAADQMIMDHDLFQRQSGGLRSRCLGSRDDLGADPDLAALLAEMDRAVHRFHRRMGEERQLVRRLDLGDCARHGLVDIAGVLRNRPRIERRLFELAHDVFCVQLGVGPVVPLDHKSRQPLCRRPHVVGHDGDGIVELHDLAHALDGLGRRIVHALHPTAEDRRLRKGRDLQARQLDVDAIDGRAVDFGRRVQPLRRRADELEVLRIGLSATFFGYRHACGVGGEIAVSGASSRRRVNHLAAFRVTGRGLDIPALCRGRHQHDPGGCARLAHRLPHGTDRVEPPVACTPPERITVELFVGRSMLELDLLQVHLQFFGDQHRDGV